MLIAVILAMVKDILENTIMLNGKGMKAITRKYVVK